MSSYLPDLPPETPDIWTVCDGFHPDIYGNYRSGWLIASISSIASPGTTSDYQHAFAYRIADGTAQVLLTFQNDAGADTAYVYNGSWNDRYAAGADNARCFAQVGNTSLLGCAASIMYRDASGTSNFAAVTGGPSFAVGSLAVNALNIVMALASNSDAFHTSDTNNPTVYNSGEATSGNVRLTPGNFTTHVAFGNDFICFKDRGVYRAQYVGGTQKWVFTLIDPEKGAWGRNCAVTANGRVVFIGRAGVYSFDGGGFERIDSGIWATILGDFGGTVALTQDYKETKLIWDPNTQNVFFFKGGGISNSSRPNGFTTSFTYNVVSGKWGRQLQYEEAGSTALYAAFDAAPLNDYVTSGLVGGAGGGPTYKTNIGFFSGADERLKIATTVFNATDVPGTNYKPKLRTSRIGGRNLVSNATRVIPHWTKSDGVGSDLSTATVKSMVAYHSDSPMEAETQGSTVTLSTDMYWGDNLKTAKYQSFEFQINAEACIAGYETDAKFAGRR